MLISVKEMMKKYEIPAKGVIHVGMHHGQEIPEYYDCGFSKIICFEANSDYIGLVQDKYPEVVIENCAVTNYNGTIEFNVTNNGESSSVLPIKYHANVYPGIFYIEKRVVPAKTLNSFNLEGYNVINLDIQGNELRALQGATDLMEGLDMIYTEINMAELYEGCCLKPELDEFLLQFGFVCVETFMAHDTWGDSVYVKKVN